MALVVALANSEPDGRFVLGGGAISCRSASKIW